jgi:Fur family iron response transcriptional regulator
MSLATVYNTLNQFAEAGLIRKISVSSQRTFFDTNARNHQHFYFEDEDRMIDIGGAPLMLSPAPQAPEGYTITKIDILVSLKKVENKQL